LKLEYLTWERYNGFVEVGKVSRERILILGYVSGEKRYMGFVEDRIC
jgi:hypothetical protein